MKERARRLGARAGFIILLAAACAQPNAVGAPTAKQGPRSAIPEDQPALRRTWPPEKSSRTSSGIEKVILFSREPIAAGAWEFIPSRPDSGVIKRVEFTRSAWSADLLVDDAKGELLSFVRLQVDTRPGQSYTVNLYRIDYSTWDVSVLAHSKPFPFDRWGAGAGQIYLGSSEGMLVMDQRTGQISNPPTPCGLLARISDDAWLVRQREGARDVLLFDPSRNAFGPSVQLSDSDHARSKWYHLSPSRRFLVSVQQPADDATGFPKIENTPLRIYDLENRKTLDYTVRTFIIAGYGVPYHFPYFDCWFSGPDELRVQSGLPDHLKPTDINVSETMFDLRGGSRSDRKVDSLRKCDCPTPPRYRPPYLTTIEEVTDVDQDLAAAFMKHKGISWKRERNWSAACIGYNVDGTRFFLRVFSGELRDRFFLGDLKKGQLLQITVPPELLEDNALNIVWVSPTAR
jgi:hypothetical protein